jgi:hypothetical protein
MQVAGAGGEGKCKGRNTVGFEQGTCVDGKFAAMKKKAAFPSKWVSFF